LEFGGGGRDGVEVLGEGDVVYDDERGEVLV